MNKSVLRRRENISGLLFSFPALALFTAFVLIPIISVFVYSFTKWDGMGTPTFIGFDNYFNIFASPEFRMAISNNLKFLVVGVPIWTITPLIIAVLLQDEIKGWKFFRSVYFFPTVLSVAVISTLFKSFFLFDGPANAILSIFGIPPIEFFANGNIAIAIVILIINWVGFGSAVLIIMAGMSSFSSEVFEAAELDGVTWFQKVRYITLPLLKPTMQLVIMLNVMAVFTALFGYIFMMTGGGPGYETTVIEYLLYVKAFKTHDFGYACALAVILFVIVSLITVLQMKISNGKDGSVV